MKALVFVMALLMGSGSCLADDKSPQAKNNQAEQPQACQKLKENGASPDTLAGQGCCSHHGGQCGCSGGSVVCCDGSYSPSCGCNKEDPPMTMTN